MKIKALVFVSVCVALSGCAWQSKALQLDTNKFQTSANASLARGGQTGARQLALANANKHCTGLGKSIQVLNVESHWAFPTNGVANVTFLCQ